MSIYVQVHEAVSLPPRAVYAKSLNKGGETVAENKRPTYYDFIRALDNQMNEYGMTYSEQLLYHTLLLINNRKHWVDWFHCTDSYLTDFMGIGITAMKNARNKLKQHGMIDFVTSKQRGTSTKYHVCNEFCTCSINVQTNNKRSTNKVQTNNKPDTNKDKREKIEDKRYITPIIPFEGILGEKVSEWLQYKQERGQKYKPTGLNGLFKTIQNESDKHGEAFVLSVIDKSITNNWNGLFFDNVKQDKGGADNRTDRQDNDGDDYSSIGWC